MNLLKLALLEIIRLKAESMQPDTQIRLMADMNYVLFNHQGSLYIGHNTPEPEEPFYPSAMHEWVNIHYRNEMETGVIGDEGIMVGDNKREELARMYPYNPADHWVYVEYFRTHSKD